MKQSDLPTIRLQNQQVVASKFRNGKDLLSWMGAMQAQDYNMAKWAVGLRLPGTTEHAVQQYIDRGDLIRTHVLRPTWHIVSAKEVDWMLDLTAPHIKGSVMFRHKQLEITPALLKKSMKVLEKALGGGEHLTREELVARLEKGRIPVYDQRAAHLLLYAELEKVICSGARRAKKNTYALFAGRISPAKPLTRDEALARLASKYFQSHGPATLQDFVWWSGLPNADAKKAIQYISEDFYSDKIDQQTYWFKDAAIPHRSHTEVIHLLPAFDEFIIGYKDRSAVLPAKHKSAVISVNGIFWPVVLVNGQVTGLWKRTAVKNKVKVEPKFFDMRGLRLNKQLKKLFDEASAKISAFFTSDTMLAG